MDLIEKWEKKYSELNEEYLKTKSTMTEREKKEVQSHLDDISIFTEDIENLDQPPIVNQSEQLIDFVKWLGQNSDHTIDRAWVYEYLQSVNS